MCNTYRQLWLINSLRARNACALPIGICWCCCCCCCGCWQHAQLLRLRRRQRNVKKQEKAQQSWPACCCCCCCSSLRAQYSVEGVVSFTLPISHVKQSDSRRCMYVCVCVSVGFAVYACVSVRPRADVFTHVLILISNRRFRTRVVVVVFIVSCVTNGGRQAGECNWPMSIYRNSLRILPIIVLVVVVAVAFVIRTFRWIWLFCHDFTTRLINKRNTNSIYYQAENLCSCRCACVCVCVI